MAYDMYLDTNIYNHLLTSPDDISIIESSIKSGQIRIIASVLTWQEIALLSKKTTEKYRNMAELLKRITHSEIFGEPRDIMRWDYESFLKSKRQAPNIFDSKYNWHQLLDRIAAGQLDDPYKGKNSEYHDYKKEHRTHVKEILRRSKGHPQLEEARNTLLEEYIERNLLDKKFIRYSLSLYYPSEIVDDLAQIVDLSVLHRERISVKFSIIQMHQHFIGAKEPKFGDNTDLQHCIYAGSVDYFVTSDIEFLEYLKLITGERVTFLSGHEFIQKLKEIKTLKSY